MIELSRSIRLMIEFVVWLAAGTALYATGRTTLAIAFVIVALGSGVVNHPWS